MTNLRFRSRTALLLTLLLLGVDLGYESLSAPHSGARLATQGGPDHNQNGIEDALDIASGVSLDADGDGCPDECDWR
jgi:hypothetical protein